MFNKFRASVARLIAPRLKPPVKTQTRMYHAAKSSRLTGDWKVSNTSADSELSSSLTALRSNSRALVRDAAYAKRAKVIVVNNVIGSGIGMQAQIKTARGGMNKRINDAIEEAWDQWTRADRCHTGGSLHFADIERLAMGQVFEAGEIVLRKHYTAFGDSSVPFALEVIEPERLADEFQFPTPPTGQSPGSMLRMGIEVDKYYRPIAYWIRERHPGEQRFYAGTDRLERVPASQIIHLRIIDRWPQTRGEPWLHAVARKLNDMDGYSEAEIVAARGAAQYIGTIESPEEVPDAEKQADGSTQMEIEPGTFRKLDPGEKLNFYTPNRPNAAMDPFMRLMLREVAAGTGTSYESLSRDYSQSNYSSSRLALLDDRDLWRVLQMWVIRNMRDTVHREWLQAAVLSRAITEINVDEYALNPRKFEAVRYKPRGWSWVDPTKEVTAFKEAVQAGFTTVSDVIAQTAEGRDIEEVLDARAHELDLMKDKGLTFDTSPGAAPAEPGKPPPDDDGGDAGQDNSESENNPRKRVVSFQR